MTRHDETQTTRTNDTRTMGAPALLGGGPPARRPAAAWRVAGRARAAGREAVAAPGHERADALRAVDDPALVLRGQERADGPGRPAAQEAPQGRRAADGDLRRAQAGDPYAVRGAPKL